MKTTLSTHRMVSILRALGAVAFLVPGAALAQQTDSLGGFAADYRGELSVMLPLVPNPGGDLAGVVEGLETDGITGSLTDDGVTLRGQATSFGQQFDLLGPSPVGPIDVLGIDAVMHRAVDGVALTGSNQLGTGDAGHVASLALDRSLGNIGGTYKGYVTDLGVDPPRIALQPNGDLLLANDVRFTVDRLTVDLVPSSPTDGEVRIGGGRYGSYTTGAGSILVDPDAPAEPNLELDVGGDGSIIMGDDHGQGEPGTLVFVRTDPAPDFTGTFRGALAKSLLGEQGEKVGSFAPGQVITYEFEQDVLALEVSFEQAGDQVTATLFVDAGGGLNGPQVMQGSIVGDTLFLGRQGSPPLEVHLADTDSMIVLGSSDGGFGQAARVAPLLSSTPKERKRAVRAALAGMLPTGDDAADKHVRKAVDELDKSLADGLWLPDGIRVDPTHGDKVFKHERKAAKELAKAMKRLAPPLRGTASNALSELVAIDRSIAAFLIDLAAGGQCDAKCRKELDKARKEQDRGDEAAAAGDADKAIGSYRNAWEHAGKALR